MSPSAATLVPSKFALRPDVMSMLPAPMVAAFLSLLLDLPSSKPMLPPRSFSVSAPAVPAVPVVPAGFVAALPAAAPPVFVVLVASAPIDAENPND
jgi:hypothetical protein